MPEIDASVSKAEAALAKAERDAARVRRLAADSVTTRTQWTTPRRRCRWAGGLRVGAVQPRYAVITAPAAGTVLKRWPGGRTGVAGGAGAHARECGARHGVPGERRRSRPGGASRGDVATVRSTPIPAHVPATVLEKGAAPAATTGAYVVTLPCPMRRACRAGWWTGVDRDARRRAGAAGADRGAGGGRRPGGTSTCWGRQRPGERRRVTIAFVGDGSWASRAARRCQHGGHRRRALLRDGETVR